MPFLQTLDTSIQELTIVNIKGVHPALSKKSCLLIPVSARSSSALILFCLVFKFNYQWNSESKKGVSPFFKRPIIILASVSILIRGFSLVCCYCSCEVGGFPGFTFAARPAVHKRLTCFPWNSLLALLPWCVQRTEIEGAWASQFLCKLAYFHSIF